MAVGPGLSRNAPAILVTGASRGIGRAIALRLANGAQPVFVNYRNNHAAAQGVCDEIVAAGGNAQPLRADVSSRDAVSSMFADIRARGHWVQTLVNNAGITRDGLAAMMSSDDWHAVIASNLDSAFYCVREALGTMTARKSGNIVNVSSVSGMRGQAGQSNYAATKGALIALTRSVAREVGRFGIRVNAVAPGFIETDMLAQLRSSEQGAALLRDTTQRFIPLQRVGTAEEVAAVVEFLCSRQAAYITGHTIVVDGGLSA